MARHIKWISQISMEKGFMRKTFITLIIYFFTINFIYSQITNRFKKRKTNIEKFVLAPFTDVISSDSIKIVTYIEVPYKILQFVKNGNLFFASYQVALGIKNRKGRELDNIVWSDSINVSNYNDTESLIKNRKHFAVFNVKVGDEYEIIGELQDLDTRKKGINKKKIDLRGFNKKPVLLRPNFMLSLPGEWGFENGKIPTNGFRVRELGLGVDLKVAGFVSEGEYEIRIFLTNGTMNDSLIQKFNGQGSSGYFSKNVFLPAKKFNALKNDFRVQLTQFKKTDEKKVSFTKYNPGIPSFVYDIELAIKQMKYILTKDEQKELKAKSKKNKEKIFFSLWKSRDPTPETEYNELMEEYFQRVAYVNEHFSGWQPGWETDRGMVYILFGPPDEIQRTNPSMTNSTLFQIWSYYSISKQFIFKDQNGFGDYRLDTPLYGIGL